MSLRNITIASSNDTAAIVYDPPVCNGGGWTTNGTQVDPSGLYKSCTITSSSKGITPSANLTFTGEYCLLALCQRLDTNGSDACTQVLLFTTFHQLSMGSS